MLTPVEYEQYPALRLVATTLTVLAWLMLGLGIFVAITGLAMGVGLWDKALVAAPSIIAGALAWVFLLAAAEGLIVLVDIERNTRLAHSAFVEAASLMRKAPTAPSSTEAEPATTTIARPQMSQS